MPEPTPTPPPQLYFADGSPVPPPPPKGKPSWLKDPIKPEIVDRALKLYAAGWSYERSAKEVGIDGSTLRNYAVRSGVARPRTARTPTRVDLSSKKPGEPETPGEQRKSISLLITAQYTRIQAIEEPEKACSAIAALARAAASLHGWGASGKSTPTGDKEERQAAKRLTEDS